MAIPKLPDRLQVAGSEYLKQLRKLGLKPEGCLWVNRYQDQHFMLWVIWSGVDTYGPYDVAKLLFKAYRASALTREIDPFSVDVISPKGDFGAQVLRTRNFADGVRVGSQPVLFRITEGSDESVIYHWSEEWLYDLRRSIKAPDQVKLDWDRFTKNVTRLAA